MSNGGIIGPTNDPVINDLITTATSSTPGFAVNPASSTVSALIVAGGGNANSGGQAGGGGAGGYRYFASIPVTGGNPYPLVVGGAATNSSAFGYTSTAGGNGNAPRGQNGLPGGSGGGAADHHPSGGGSGGSGNAGGFTPPEGNPGSGASPGSNSGETPGAGGGSTSAGAIETVNGTPFVARGGEGTPNSITGTDLWYATGGFYPGGKAGPNEVGWPTRSYPGDWPAPSNPDGITMANTGNGAQGEGPGSGASGVVVVKEAGLGGFVASGVWGLTEQLKAKKEGNWK